MIKLVLIRHGQSEWNLSNLFTGWTDVHLSEQGEKEAHDAGKLLKEKGYSFSAGQYFEVKIEYVDITPEEFEAKMNEYKATLADLFAKGDQLQKDIQESLERLKYE